MFIHIYSFHIVQVWCVPAQVSLYFVWTAQNEFRDCPQYVLICLLRMIWRQTVCQTLNSITVRCVVSDVAQFNFVQHPFPLFKHGGTVHHDMVGSLSTSFTRTVWCVVELVCVTTIYSSSFEYRVCHMCYQ